MRKLYAFTYIWLRSLFVELARTELAVGHYWGGKSGYFIILPRLKWPHFPSVFEHHIQGSEVVWKNSKSPDFKTFGFYVVNFNMKDGTRKIGWTNDGKKELTS